MPTEKDSAPKLPMLVSYAFLREAKESVLNYILDNPYVEILLDSGAFSALNAGQEIDLQEYMDFLKKHDKKIFRYIALDKLGDPKQTDINLQIMLKNGLNPVPVHVRGDGKERMDELFSYSDYVAMGGFRRPHRGPADKSYVKKKMEWANGRNVHWLGYTVLSMVQEFKPYSCDCSSINGCFMYGNLDIYLGGGRWSKYDYSKYRALLKDRKAINIIEQLGFTVGQLADSKAWRYTEESKKQSIIAYITSASWVKYVYDIRKNVGTRMFIANVPGHPIIDFTYMYANKFKKIPGPPYPLSREL